MNKKEKKILAYFGSDCLNLKNKKRGERLFQLKKKKIKCLKQLIENYDWPNVSLEQKQIIAAKNAVTPQRCSCYVCGNPRKWWKEITEQEKKFNLEIEDNLKEEKIKIKKIK